MSYDGRLLLQHFRQGPGCIMSEVVYLHTRHSPTSLMVCACSFCFLGEVAVAPVSIARQNTEVQLLSYRCCCFCWCCNSDPHHAVYGVQDSSAHADGNAMHNSTHDIECTMSHTLPHRCVKHLQVCTVQCSGCNADVCIAA